MIDTHCHLTDPRLYGQLDAVIARARAAGVDRLITIGTDIEDDRAAVALCRHRPGILCCIGIHPNYVKDARLEDVQELRSLQDHPSVLALGEMGLDYHHDDAPRALQRRFFEAQLELAGQLQRPVVVHCRQAVDDTLAILGQFPAIRAVFHCFTGTSEQAGRILDGGYYLGFTGPVTFKRSDELRCAVRRTPLDRLLLETDAPYLSPEPVRATRINEPAFVMHTAAAVAALKDVSLGELGGHVVANAQRLFGRPLAPMS